MIRKLSIVPMICYSIQINKQITIYILRDIGNSLAKRWRIIILFSLFKTHLKAL